MNEELAIKLLHPEKSDETIYILKEYDCLTDNIIEDAIRKARLLACEALERQIPKEAEIRPLYFENSKEPVEHLVHCPVCDSPVCFTTEYDVRENYKYCPRCGQKIEWSEV